jgi:phospholipid/cholesterol/gamma-HCH transport system substrate-binding protein
MTNYGENNIKLGILVSAGLLVLILSFYVIGKNHNLFGSGFVLKARFSQLDGLAEGNNVLFSGIQAGTVKNISIINDTTIEVVLLIDNKVKSYIHENALATIGTEGLMGNKMINIMPIKGNSPIVKNGDLLTVQPPFNKDDMLQTLAKTNNNIAAITETVRGTVLRVDGSDVFKVINDKSLGVSLRSTFGNVNKAAAKAREMMNGMNQLVVQMKAGKGAAGLLLTDTAFAGSLKETLSNIKLASNNTNKLTIQLNSMVNNVNQDLFYGKGSIHSLLRDSVMAENLSSSMENVRKGTAGFNQNMDALKHNFLLRGYFKRLAKQQKKQKEDSLKNQNKLAIH